MKLIQHFYKKLGVIVLILCSVVVLSRFFYFRWDLTPDKRYTLSPTTQNILLQVKEPLFVDVLLTGELPLAYKKLQTEVLQLLEEYRTKNSQVIFRFINPLEDSTNPNEELKNLMQNGLYPVEFSSLSVNKSSKSYFFPWAVLSYGNQMEKVSLLKNKLGASEEENVANSVQNLEYALTDGIYKLLNSKSKKIAVLRGQGTLKEVEIADFLALERNYYYIAPFTLDSVKTNAQKTLNDLLLFDLLIVPKPTLPFTDEQKQVLDQYVMAGKKVLWLVDATSVSLQDLYQSQGKTVAMPLDLNLADMFFKYGFRLNYNLINDLYFTQIVLAQGSESQTQYIPVPWVYSPMVLARHNPHLVNSNLDAIRLQFASSIDTLANGVKKEVLLSSSLLSKTESIPREISLEQATTPPNKDTYTTGNYSVAIFLQGSFPSAFKNRVKPLQLSQKAEQSTPTAMIIISDGDIIRNEVSKGTPLELGYDKWTNNFYDNKIFLQNCVNYLLNEMDFLTLRDKKITMPVLNKKELEQSLTYWQLIGIFIPLLIISLIGLSAYLWHKKYFLNKF